MNWSSFSIGHSFWGKLKREHDDTLPSEWHPLVDHCIDVACCAEALLKRTLIGKRLAHLAGVEEFSPAQVARLSVMVGLHDIGKFNTGFQKRYDKNSKFTGHVGEGLNLIGVGCNDPLVSKMLDCDRLLSWFDPLDSGGLVLMASICHHGELKQIPQDAALLPCWKDPRTILGIGDLSQALRRVFPDSAVEAPAINATSAFQHAFQGMVTLADWLGSDTRMFPYTREDVPHREVLARRAAQDILLKTGLEASAYRQTLPKFSFERMSGGKHPRPLQQAMIDLVVKDRPSTVLIESETGSGKTEAALSHFFKMYEGQLVDGMFFALPTRAASVQIFHRVKDAVKNMWGEEQAPPVVLAVPGYRRVDDDVGNAVLSSFKVLWSDDVNGGIRNWAGEGPKRFLAGAIVVGTIDQALLASLNTEHSAFRMISLTRQLLVVDEVHATDTYMNAILKGVLAKHLKAGGHALLMSATYGEEARASLVGGPSPKGLLAASQEPYPRVCVEQGGIFTALPVKALERRKEVFWETMAVGQDDQMLTLAANAAKAGAKVIILRNTVGDAVATHEAIENVLPNGLLFTVNGVSCPHHGRFTARDRRLLDHHVEQRFRSSGGFVIVSTQTLEQSLDIDADLLITDLCPMDVLLQRVGRLHRHVRARPPGFTEARCVVLVPDKPFNVNQDTGAVHGGHGWGEAVYKNASSLQLTWNLLKTIQVSTIPDDNRMLVERSVHSEADADLCALDPSWSKHTIRKRGTKIAQTKVAGYQQLDWGKDVDDVDHLCIPGAKTRLSEDSRKVLAVQPHSLKSPFGEAFDEVHIPGWGAGWVSDTMMSVTARMKGDEIRFDTAGKAGVASWSYSRRGLMKIPKEAE